MRQRRTNATTGPEINMLRCCMSRFGLDTCT
jgi:hypothetical protein